MSTESMSWMRPRSSRSSSSSERCASAASVTACRRRSISAVRSASVRSAAWRRSCVRSLVSRMALVTRTPSSVSSGLKLISTGNSVPSLRRPKSSRPEPMPRTRGSAKYAVRFPGWRPRKRSGISISTPWPSSSSLGYPNSRSVCEFTRTIFPVRSTITTASGAASSSPRNFASTLLRSLTSRIAAVTRTPSPVCMGERLISAGNSVPSLRWAWRSSPAPIGRVRGSVKYPRREPG